MISESFDHLCDIRSRYKQIANDRDGDGYQVGVTGTILFSMSFSYISPVAGYSPKFVHGPPWPCRSVSSPRPAESAECGW